MFAEELREGRNGNVELVVAVKTLELGDALFGEAGRKKECFNRGVVVARIWEATESKRRERRHSVGVPVVVEGVRREVLAVAEVERHDVALSTVLLRYNPNMCCFYERVCLHRVSKRT